MPAIVVVCLVAWLVIWFFASRDAEDLVNGFLAGGGLLSAVGLACGLVHGNVGTNDSEFAIGHFMATGPITNADLTRTILRAAAQSVLLAWAMRPGVSVRVFDAHALRRSAHGGTSGRSWLVVSSATLVGLWTAVGCVTSIGLAGRAKLFTQLMCGLFAAFIGLTLLSKFRFRTRADVAVRAGAGGGHWSDLHLGHGLDVSRGTPPLADPMANRLGAVGAWAVASAIALFQLPAADKADTPSILLVAGLLALAVAPLAASGSALTWNRHR